MGLNGVKILMISKTTMLEVMVILVLVQSVSVTILYDAVLKAVVEVDMMVRDDAALKVVVMRARWDCDCEGTWQRVKEESEEVVVVTDTGDVADAVGQAMQVFDGRIVAVVVRTTICRCAYHHH